MEKVERERESKGGGETHRERVNKDDDERHREQNTVRGYQDHGESARTWRVTQREIVD